jgi:hypothetical protein
MPMQIRLVVLVSLVLAFANPALARATEKPDSQSSQKYCRSFNDPMWLHATDDAAYGQVTANCCRGTHDAS